MRNRRKKRRRSCNIGAALALVAFCGAVMCLSFFSLKFLLFAVAVLFIILGIYLLKL